MRLNGIITVQMLKEILLSIIGGSWGMSAVSWFIDLPSLLMILIPGLLIMGEWKDFIKVSSVGNYFHPHSS